MEEPCARERPTCIIVGAGPRLGLAIAERYAREGFSAYMLLRNPQRLERQIAWARARNLSVIPLVCDVSCSTSVKRTVDYIKERTPNCDVLIYNAFAPSAGPVSSLDAECLLSEFRVNVAGALSFVKLFSDDMRTRSSGTILFSGCGLAYAPSAAWSSLSVSKAALRALVDCVAEEAQADGVRVGMVTINGMIPSSAAALKMIADLYWQLFVRSDQDHQRELWFNNELSPE
jgi:NAD(P)-dependent dehydrogenase (short-subunit alcohol dehydrogenase family)